jgi:hypothetical protein
MFPPIVNDVVAMLEAVPVVTVGAETMPTNGGAVSPYRPYNQHRCIGFASDGTILCIAVSAFASCTRSHFI